MTHTYSINTTRFGELFYNEEDIIVFPRGIPGFERNHKWAIAGDEDSIIKWLQSLDDAELALPITTPDIVMLEYNARIPDDEIELLGEVQSNEDLALLSVVSIPPAAPWDMTVNLRAPILVNVKTRRAAQIIVLNEDYHLRHPVFSEAARTEMKENARKSHEAEQC
ncbi:MAG: flagellar assembly protein FliW [Synergistaceae bacterium]|nr:flagellar assembly protein FliW [Synergistaceae bacterium]